MRLTSAAIIGIFALCLSSTSFASPNAFDAHAQNFVELANSDAVAAARKIESEAIVKKALSGLKLPGAFVTAYSTNSVPALDVAYREVFRGRRFTLLGSVKGSKNTYRYRVLIPGGGFSYLELKFAKRKKSYAIVDVKDILAGDWASVATRRQAITGAVQAGIKIGKRASKVESLAIKYVALTTAFMSAARTRDWDKVLELYPRLPKTLQNDRNYAFLHLSALGGKPEHHGEYQKRMEWMRKTFAEDIGGILMSIDYYFLKGDFDQLLKTVDRADAIVADPYLDTFRFLAYSSQGNLPGMRSASDRLMKNEPDIESTWSTRMTLGLVTRNHKMTAKAMTVLEQRFDTQHDVEALRKEPSFAEFFKSKAGKKYNAKK